MYLLRYIPHYRQAVRCFRRTSHVSSVFPYVGVRLRVVLIVLAFLPTVLDLVAHLLYFPYEPFEFTR